MDINSLRNFIFNVCSCNDDTFFIYLSFVPREECETLDCLPSTISQLDPTSEEYMTKITTLANLIDTNRPQPPE